MADASSIAGYIKDRYRGLFLLFLITSIIIVAMLASAPLPFNPLINFKSKVMLGSKTSWFLVVLIEEEEELIMLVIK